MVPKVLFVDDEPINNKAMVRSFRYEPFDLLTAESAQDALQILSREPVDIVVSDECMPGTSGFKFLAQVSKTYPDTIRIILSGHGHFDEDQQIIDEAEIFRILTKPIDHSELVSVLHQAYREKQRIENEGGARRKSNVNPQ